MELGKEKLNISTRDLTDKNNIFKFAFENNAPEAAYINMNQKVALNSLY
ncbi:hypothetical protein [Paenibacillus sp. N3.4]|nr:hypothetical protein [Paenibacillus sp. N3.4]